MSLCASLAPRVTVPASATITNLGLFPVYMIGYLIHHPKILSNMPLGLASWTEKLCETLRGES